MPNCTCQHCNKAFDYKAKEVRHQPQCHRILVGDSTRQEDVARAMGGQRAVLMATDPPYLVDYQGGNHPQSWSNKPEVRDKHWDDYQEGEACELFTQFLKLALDVALIGNPAVYQWHAHKRQALVESAWQRADLLVHQQIIWLKTRAVLTHSHFMWQHEPCFYGWVKGKPPTKRPPPNVTTVWQIDQKGLEGLHPTQKPLEIVTRPISYHTEPGNVIYEPFSGSGTALAAAEATGRVCCAIEMAEAFVAVALERLEQMGLEPRLNDGTRGR
jgi:DNA modification methylase